MKHPWRQWADEYIEFQLSRFSEDIKEMVAESGELTPAAVADLLSCVVAGSEVPSDGLEAVRARDPETIEALRELLLDSPPRMQFVKVVLLDAGCAPIELTHELCRAAVHTPNPSFNRHFVEEISRVNPRGVRDVLAEFVRTGTPWEVAGAVNALYWAGGEASSNLVEEEEEEWPEPRTEQVMVLLERFVHEENLDMRRSLMTSIPWTAKNPPSGVAALLEAAHRIASGHEDPYIRQRYATETGMSRVLPCLPHRPTEPAEGGGSGCDAS